MKMQFRRSKPLSYKAFCDHFSCALLHAEHNLTQLYHTIHLTICQVKIALIIFMYFLQNTTIKHFTYHLFSQTFLCVPFTLCLFKKITHHPPRAACLLHEHLCLSRASFYILCEMLNDFVAGIYGNILYISIFDCSGFLRAKEYHFLSEVQPRPPPIFHIKNISVQSALCWMYHPLTVGHEC